MDSFIGEMRTLPFWAITVMSVLGAWSMTLQGRRIWRARSVATLSIPFAWYSIAFYCIVLLYGVDQSRWAMVINGILRGATFLPVIAGVIMFHEHSRGERLIALSFVTLVGTMILLPYREYIFLAQSFLGLGLFLTQPYAIIRDGQTGVLEIRIYVVALFTTTFYTWYGYRVGDAIVLYTSMLFAVSQLFTISLFRIYPEYCPVR